MCNEKTLFNLVKCVECGEMVAIEVETPLHKEDKVVCEKCSDDGYLRVYSKPKIQFEFEMEIVDKIEDQD